MHDWLSFGDGLNIKSLSRAQVEEGDGKIRDPFIDIEKHFDLQIEDGESDDALNLKSTMLDVFFPVIDVQEHDAPVKNYK